MEYLKGDEKLESLWKPDRASESNVDKRTSALMVFLTGDESIVLTSLAGILLIFWIGDESTVMTSLGGVD